MPQPLPLHRLASDSPDGELLGRYVRERDERAFAALVRRHGRMVKAVCRRVLANDADADDATQATFVILVRKASAIRDRNGLANWLFGVAHNVAVKARQTRTRRAARESKVPPRPPEQVASDFADLLHAELAKLPAAFRAAVVLCDLEGHTVADAARHLGVPVGTAASRLARGRSRLADRLRALGLGVSVGMIATLIGESAQASPVTFDPFAEVSEPVQLLTREVMRTMFTTPKTKLLAVVLAGAFALSLAAVGVAQAPPKVTPPPKAEPPKPEATDEDSRSRPAPLKGFTPFFTLSQALVEWDGDDKLKVWIQVPVSRFLKLTDAKGRAVHVHDSTYRELGPQSVSTADVEVFDLAGNKKAKADWKKVLNGRTQMLFTPKSHYDSKSFRVQFGTFLKEDVLVLVVSQEVYDSFEPLKNLPEIESLPQTFPGQPEKPGDPMPPTKPGDPK